MALPFVLVSLTGALGARRIARVLVEASRVLNEWCGCRPTPRVAGLAMARATDRQRASVLL